VLNVENGGVVMFNGELIVQNDKTLTENVAENNSFIANAEDKEAPAVENVEIELEIENGETEIRRNDIILLKPVENGTSTENTE
jgi:hypothetical protein